VNDLPSPESDLLDEAVAAMRRMASPDRPPDQFVIDALRQSRTRRFATLPRELYHRTLRMNPIVRYAIVALVLSAIVLVGFGRRSGTLLLADVMAAVSKHKTVRFDSKNESDSGEAGQQRPARTSTDYATLDNMHVRIEASSGMVTILDRAKGVFLLLDPREKMARVRTFPGKMHDAGVLGRLEELEKDKTTTSAREQFKGSEVIAYRLTKEGVKSTILVDPKTELPVRVEMEHSRPSRRGQPPEHEKVTMSNFAWDPPIADPARFFSVEPPAGYKVETRNLFADPPSGEKTPRP
jgi:hypothetical protein